MGVKTLNLPNLKLLVTKLIDDAIAVGGSDELILERNYYWSIPGGELYATRDKPQALDVGSVWDDAEFLSAAMNDQERIHHLLLSHVVPLLTYLAERDFLDVPS